MIKELKKESKLSRLVIGLAICCLLLASMSSCKKKKPFETQKSDFIIKAETLIEKEAEITNEYTVEHHMIGHNFEANEAYIIAPPSKERFHRIQIVDMDTGKTKRELKVPMGGFESPTDFYDPYHMQYLDGKYYVIDKFAKIVVYDEQLKRLFTSILPGECYYFFDFFKLNNQCKFVLGTQIHRKNLFKSDIEWYDLPGNRRPSKIDKLSHFEFPRVRWNNKPGYCLLNYFTPSTCGFEKDGKIYYGDMTSPYYLEYDLKTHKTSKIELSFLKLKKFTDKDAEKFGHICISSDGEDDFFRSTGLKFRYASSPNTFYHFGLFDVGKSKIGIIGDLKVKQMKYRLDIIDCISQRYIESIWFLINVSLCDKLEAAGGKSNDCFNWDKGIRLCNDRNTEEDIYFVRITKYRCKNLTVVSKN